MFSSFISLPFEGHSTFLTLSSLPLEMGGYPGSYNGYSKEDSLSIQHLPVPCHHQHYTSFISEHCETLKCRWRVGRPRYCDDRESLHGCDELEFRGDKDTSTSKLGGDSALLPKGHTRQGSSRKETDTTVQYPVDSQGNYLYIYTKKVSSNLVESRKYCTCVFLTNLNCILKTQLIN